MIRSSLPLAYLLVLLVSSSSAQEGWTPPTSLKPAGSSASTSTLSPTGHAYAARVDVGGVDTLFITPVGGTPAPVSGVALGGSGLRSFEFAPDGTQVVFDDQSHDVFAVPTNDPTGAVALSAPLVTGGRVATRYVSPNSARVVYRADQDVDGVTELYSVLVDGSAAPTKLNGALVAGGNVWSASFSPDGQTVLYIADQEVDEQRDLYRVPADGSAAPVKVNVGGGQDVFGAEVTANGTTIVIDSTIGLHSAPLDGSAPPTYIGTSSGAWRAALSTDSLRVAWRVGSTVYVGSTSISGAAQLSAGSDFVDGLTFSPDSQRVFWQETTYLADSPDTGSDQPPPGEDEGLQRLWSASAYGGGKAILASDYWYSYESYYFFSVSGDSKHVVYKNSEHIDVRTVPASGGASVAIAPTAPGRRPSFSGSRATRRNHVFLTERDAGYMDEHLIRVAMDGTGIPEIVVAPNNPGDNLTFTNASGPGRHVAFSVYDGVETTPYFTLRKVHLGSVVPYIGPQAGGTVVWLRGDGFSAETEVFFGTRKVPTLFVDEGTLIVRSPPAPSVAPHKKLRRAARVVDVTVRNVGAESRAFDAFSYYR